ncbi:hypothetical protein [Nostoc commune]|uniref:hypothetical protein n=1 Tax=Nostoc commune TaxID=1178 RepID=UPI0018C4B0A5|nr:hypothetical protein [Nostoc commune]MBG1262386.1 hypothetical protein [Nostoc commune BAE]
MIISQLKSLLISLSLSPLFLGLGYFPSQAQTPNSLSGETITRVVTLKKTNGENLSFQIVGLHDRANNAAIVLATVLGVGVDANVAKIVISIVLAGADPVLTTDLILNLNGLVTDQTGVNLTKLNQAINAYNTIVDKADANSLKALNNTPAFTSIGALLQNLRERLG